MSFKFIVKLRRRKSLTPKDVTAVKVVNLLIQEILCTILSTQFFYDSFLFPNSGFV
jgi:hypothetical protein